MPNEPVLYGSIHDHSGNPVKNADICIYRSDYYESRKTGNSGFPRGASRCRKTDKDGNYVLNFPDRSMYTLIAGKKGRWTKRTLFPANGGDTIFITDTLRPTGALLFRVLVEGAANNSATVSLEGTPYLVTTDTSGTARIAAVPAGVYGAIICSLYKGYRTVRCSLRVRSAESDTFKATVIIPKEMPAYVPEKVSMVGVEEEQRSPPVSTGIPSTMLVKNRDSVSVTINTPLPKTPIQPELQVKHIPTFAHAPADTFIGIFEPLILAGQTDTEGITTKKAWDIGGTGRFVPTENGTIEVSPFKTPVNRLPCIFRVTDNTGISTFDTTHVYAGLLWMSISPPADLLGRNGHTLTVFNDELYIIGGGRSDVWSSPDGVNWTLLTDTAPFGKIAGHTTVVFMNRLFVFGGRTGETLYHRTVWSSSTGVQWRKEATAPFRGRIYHSAVVFAGKIYCIGGISESGDEPFLNDIWTSGNGTAWDLVQPQAPFGKRYGHGCAVFNNRIVVLGGFNDEIGNKIAYNDVWESDDGISWTAITEHAPFEKEQYHTVISFDDKLWVIGGYFANGNTGDFSNVFFSADGLNWTNCTRGKKAGDQKHINRSFCACAPLGNRIVVSPSDSRKLWIMR